MSDIKAPRVLSASQLNDLGNGTYTVTVTNPLPASYLYMPPKGTLLNDNHGMYPEGSDLVLSIQPSGDYEVRAKGTSGGYEQCVKEGGFLVFSPTGVDRFKVPFA